METYHKKTNNSKNTTSTTAQDCGKDCGKNQKTTQAKKTDATNCS